MLSALRYLTFEVNADCNMAHVHPKCPVSDPERYMFGDTSRTLSDDDIVEFYNWAYQFQGFRGSVLWHLYNEPTLVLDRIRGLQSRIQQIVPDQHFHLWTNSPMKLVGFHHVQHTNYADVRPDDLDNRRASTSGEGRAYLEMQPEGRCGRSFGWEVIIDNHGNWLLCCNDWRCEEATGNILIDRDWEFLLEKFRGKAEIVWHDADSYAALPRMCRSCMDVNPNLSRSALPVVENRA